LNSGDLIPDASTPSGVSGNSACSCSASSVKRYLNLAWNSCRRGVSRKSYCLVVRSYEV
jgi:hypothetical protein